MTKAWSEVLRASVQNGISLRTAATVLAVERVAEAHRMRGLYP